MADTGMEAKMAYDNGRKEVIQALTKKRGIDKSLVRSLLAPGYRPFTNV